jgi:hypothetical protein
LLRILCIFLGAYLLSLSVLFCFIFCNKWLDPNKLLLEKMHSFFHCQEHSSFHSYRSTSVLFSNTAFSFHFSPWFLSRSCYFFVSRCIYTSGLWWFSCLRIDSKRLNGVGK